MKRVVASLIIGACLLLPSAGVVLAGGNPHLVTGTKTTGQPGTPTITCGNPILGTTGPAIASQPGNLTSASPAYASPGSPFTPSGGVGGSNYNPSAQYDVACFQAP
jgi:hypothetical protein